MITDLLQKALDRRRSQPGAARIQTLPPVDPPLNRIPTLAPNLYRPITPELRDRFSLFGRWMTATHGHWLSLQDMEELWVENPAESLIAEIKLSRIAGEENWPNDVSALFKPERLSLFAGSDLGNEKIYLLWLDCEDEPELWVYDSNGESRYKDLSSYLEAFLANDVSASERRWKLADAERLDRKT